MKVYKRGKKTATNLTQKDFVTSGGEGKIYHVGNLAYKVYHNPKGMPPEAKINELTVLNRPNIIRPIDILMDKRNQIIGYSTKWVDGIPLCKVFVAGFRKREGIKDDHVIKLVENIKETIDFIHSKKIIMVDGNEMNYIVGKDHTTPYFIDTTCWQTPSFPAQVIMPSIRDWKTKGFNEMSDWFSFGVISCWLFTGVHPFKGKHDKYDKKYPDIIERMRHRVLDCISIFNTNVRVAANAHLNKVPGHYRDWFLRVFEKGERIPPPGKAGVIVFAPITVRTIKGTNNFVIDLWKTFDEDVLGFSKVNGIQVVKTTGHLSFKRRVLESSPTKDVVFSPKYQIPIVAEIKDGFLELDAPDGGIGIGSRFAASELMVINNTLYYRYYDQFRGVSLVENGSRKVYPTTTGAHMIMPKSSLVFSGVVIQNMLGKIYATIPVPRDGSPAACYDIQMPELDGYRILDAKHSNRVLVVFGQKKSEYHTLIFRFDSQYSDHDFRKVDCDNVGEVNMTVLDNGIAIVIPKDGVLEAFSNKPHISDVKSIHDQVINTGMKLCNDGTKAMFIRDNEIYTISMK
jgi:hypothetical protein